MSKFALGCVYYNDVKSLERMLDSAARYFDYCIMIDGAYFNHAGENRFSTDGSRELVESYDNVISLGIAELTEGQKRNAYLYLCKELSCEWLLILDSDEYITVEGNFKRNAIRALDIENNHYVYDIMSKRYPADYEKFDPRPRMWYEPWDMQYTTCHCCYGRKDGKVRKSERPCIEGIKIYHDHDLRTDQHSSDWTKFVTYQLQAESQDGISL